MLLLLVLETLETEPLLGEGFGVKRAPVMMHMVPTSLRNVSLATTFGLAISSSGCRALSRARGAPASANSGLQN
jgi:hypothetical protein